MHVCMHTCVYMYACLNLYIILYRSVYLCKKVNVDYSDGSKVKWSNTKYICF